MISVIIPTYNEADTIAQTINAVRMAASGNNIKEIIVADGQSTDETVAIAENGGALVFVCSKKGRAAQMNWGSRQATAPILYFLHADSIPPPNFDIDIMRANSNGNGIGCFMLAFDQSHWFLKANCWFTRFNTKYFRFGDQSLFVTKEIFDKAKGFREDLIVMEDQEIIGRLKKWGKFTVIKKPVITSARKYRENGVYKTQGIFFLIYFMYYLGFSQPAMVKTFRRLMKQHKV